MRFDPSLQVRRVVISRGEALAYDESFHSGINIIRGENSSGKSTVLNFIFYGLGGDLADWSGAALQCDRVYVEVSLNGKVATLGRDVAAKHGQPMDVYGGTYEASLKAPHTDWHRYSYKRSSSRESFSQAIFRLLEIPEVANEISGNVTVHQILRLLYADQLSPVESLFRSEQFDSPVLRDTVGRLLCGAFDNELYENELRIRDLIKQLDAATGELRSLFNVLGKAEHNLTLEWISGQRRVLLEKIEAVRLDVSRVEQAMVEKADSPASRKAQIEAYEILRDRQISLTQAREKMDALKFDMADSAAFISSLERKMVALNDTSAVIDEVGEVGFQFCPACYAPIESATQKHICHLCKTPYDRGRAKTRVVALINDAAIQLKQSRILQGGRSKEADALESELKNLGEQWEKASRRYQGIRSSPSSELQSRLAELHRQAGYLDRELEDLAEKEKLVALIDKLSATKAQLSEELAGIRSQNEKIRFSQQQRLSQAYTQIADEIRELLHEDLRRQDSFENAERVEFDFGANRISVDGESYFSASSRVILKNCFFLGFLLASLKKDFFRHPRFCMIDTVEDKGIEPVRSHNFQLLMRQRSEQSGVDHQIIFATAMIAPDLDDEKYTVGKYSTRDDPALNLGQS